MRDKTIEYGLEVRTRAAREALGAYPVPQPINTHLTPFGCRYWCSGLQRVKADNSAS